MKKQCHILRIHRSTAELPSIVPVPVHRVTAPIADPRGYDPVLYDPWICVACGHPHHFMTRHHRLPKRVAWKIPAAIWREVLQDGQRVVPMCGRCHAFIETRKKAPCDERPNHKYVKLSWQQLMEEIETFDRIAYERTEALIKFMRAEDYGRDPDCPGANF